MKTSSKVLIIVISVIVIVAFAVFALWLAAKPVRQKNTNQNQSVHNFQECAAAGNPIQQTFPPTCVTPSGQSFTDTSKSLQ